jgi:hypothetical protein
MSEIKRTNDEWRVLLAKQRASGLTQREWCLANGINLYTLRDRAWKINQQDREAQGRSGQRETSSVNWVGVSPENMAWPESLPEARGNPGRMPPPPLESEPPARETPATEANPKSFPVDMCITCGGWKMTITACFDASLLADVLRAVNQACC